MPVQSPMSNHLTDITEMSKRCRDGALYIYLHFYIIAILFAYFLACHPYISFPYLLSLLQNINRTTKIYAMNGKPFFVVDIIAHILHHLKCRLLTEVTGFVQRELKASDIDWVITVPAIWKSKGKKMMREAGYMVSPQVYL